MFNTNSYGNESIPSYTQGVDTPWPSHATHSNQNLFHQHGVASNPNAFVGYGLGQVQSKELDLAGVVGMKETSGASSTPSATTNAWHHSHHRMRYSSTAATSRGFLPYQMSSLPHYDSQSVDSSHLTHGTHHQFWMSNPNAYSLMQNYNQRDHNTCAERADTSRSTGAIRHNTTMSNRTYAVEDQSRNVNTALQQQPAEVLSQHCQRPSRQPIHQLQQHQQIHHQQEYLRNTITQRERDPCQYANSSYHQESMRVGVDTTLYHEQHVMPSTQHQHPQYQASQEALRKAESERRAAFTSRQTWPQTWAKAPAYVPFDASQAFLSNHRSSGSAFQPCNKQAGTDPYSMDSIWAKSAVPTPSSHVPHATNHTIPSTNNHIPLPSQSWIHDTTPHFKSNVYRPPQDMNQMTNVPSNFSTNVLNLDTGQVELSMSVVPPDLSLYSQAVPQTQRHRTTTAHPASVEVQQRHRPLPTPAVPQNHVKPVLKEAPPKPMESSKPTSTARAAGLDVRQFLATWDEDLDIATPRPAIIETDEPEPPEPAATSLVVLDYQTVPSEEAAGLLQMYPGLQLSGNDSVVLLDETATKTNLDFVLSRAVPTTTSLEMVSAPASDVQVSQSSSAIDVAQSPASGTTPAASTSDSEKLNSNTLEASPCSANKSSSVGENHVDLSVQPRSQEALTTLSVCESDSEKQKKTSLRLFRKRKAVSAESDASSQCSEHADEISAKCMKFDNSLSNWFGNDSMDTIDGPIRTPVSVSSAAYDPSSSAAQSPVDSMGVIEEKSAEDSANPESTAVSVITMNRGAKDRIGRSMPDIFGEAMYEVDQAPSRSVGTGRRDTDDLSQFDKAEVAVGIAGSQGSGERDRESQEQSGRNTDLDRNLCNNTYQEHSHGIRNKLSPETKSPVAEFDSKRVQQPNELSEEDHGTRSLQTFKTDFETIFSDQEFSRNTDQEISKKFKLDSGDKTEEKTREEPLCSEDVPSTQLNSSNTSYPEPTVTADRKRHNSVDSSVMHRSPTEVENQRPLAFFSRELCNLMNQEQSKITTAQTCDSSNQGVGDITRGEPNDITEKIAHIHDPEEIGKGDSISNVGDDFKNENLGNFSDRQPSDFVNRDSVDYAQRDFGDFSSLKRSDFMIQMPSDMNREPIDMTNRESSNMSREPSDISRDPSDMTTREPSDMTSQEPNNMGRELSNMTSPEPSNRTSREPSDMTSREPSNMTSPEPSNMTNWESSDVTSRQLSDVTSREPSEVISREPSDVLSNVTSREPSDVRSDFTSREPSDFTGREPSDFTVREPSDFTSREPSDFTSREPSDFTRLEPSGFTRLEPSGFTRLEPSGFTRREPSDFTSREPSDFTSREPSDFTSREPSDFTSWEPSDFTSREPSDVTSRKHWDTTSGEFSITTSREPSHVTEQVLREMGSVGSSDFTVREPHDFTNRGPGDFVNWDPIDFNHAPTNSRDPAPTDTGNEELSGSGNLKSIKFGNQEPCQSDHLESIEPSSVVSRDSFKNWEEVNLGTHENSDLVNQEPNDAVNLEHVDSVNQERSVYGGKMGIDNSMAANTDISFDPVGEEPSNITAEDQNLISNANVKTLAEPPPTTSSMSISEKEENEKEVAAVCRYALSKPSEGSQKTTQYLSRIVGSAPGKIPKILLSRLKNVRDKKRKNGVQKLPCIRLTRVQMGTSPSVNEPPEYICRGDSRSEDLGDRRSVSDSPNHELRHNEVQKTDSPVGQCSDFEVESSCREESSTENKRKTDSPLSLEPGELRETALSSDGLPSPERFSPLQRLDACKDVQEPLREIEGFSFLCNSPKSEDLAFTNSSEPNCVDLTVSQAYELSNTDTISRPTTPVSPFEKKMSSGQMFRNKSPDFADRPNQNYLQSRPVRRRGISKRRFSLPSPKSFEEDATFDSPLQSKSYQTENKALTNACKYTLVPVRMRSVSAEAVESKINEMFIESKGDADRSNERGLTRVEEVTEKISSSWEEDSRDMIVPELCKNFPEVRQESEKIDSVFKSLVHSSNGGLEIRGPEKDFRRQNSESSFRRSRKGSPAGFDSPWPGNSRERDSSSSDEDDSNDSSDTSSSSSSKTSRRSSSSDSSGSDTSSDEYSDDEKNAASAVKEDISSAWKENIAKTGKEGRFARKEGIVSTGREDIASVGKEDTASPWKEDIASAENEDIASAGKEDIASPGKEDITSPGKEDIASAGKEDIASAGKEDIASADTEDVTSADTEDIASAGKEDIASAGMEDIASADTEDVTSADTENVASADTEEIASADKEDIASADKECIISAGKEDECENDKINNIVASAADELVQADTFAPEKEVQVKGGSSPDRFTEDQGISPRGIQCNVIFDAHGSDFNGDQVLQKTESLSAAAVSISHSVEPRAYTNDQDYDDSDLPEVSDSSNCHAFTDHVSKELFATENASLVSITCQEGADVNYSSMVDDTCPVLEPADRERPLPISESTEMPCLEKIIRPEATSVKTDLPQILNHIGEMNGTDLLVEEDTLLVFTNDAENVFVQGEDGCVQVEVEGENAEFHAVQDENAGEFNIEVQGENAVGIPVEVQGGNDLEVYDENVGEVPVEVEDDNGGEFPVEVQDENAEEFAAEVQDGNAGKLPVESQDERTEDFFVHHFHEKTEEFHIVVDEEQYNGLCNGTMEVFTSDSMKTFTVESIPKGELHCEEVVHETEHPDQGDFYCDEIGSAPVEEVVNSETTCDIEGEKVCGFWREEGEDIPAPLESVDESLFDEVLSEKEETGSSCNELPLEMKCSLSWDRILNEGQGLVLGPANVEVRVPGESAKETTHWKVVTRERKRPGTSKTSSCVEENNNIMLDVKSPIIVVKRLVLKRPRTRRSQRKREEDTLGDIWKDAKILPPLKTKGALKAFQAHPEGTHLRNRNRSWPAASGDTTWKRRRMKRRRSDLSPPARTYSSSSPQRLPKVIIKKTGPQYQSFICGDDVFMQPVVSIERNAELDNLALTMWSEGSSPTSSVGLSPQHDSPDQTNDLVIGNGNQVHRGRRKQPKTGRAGQLMKVVELLQQWRQAEQEAASKVSQDSLQSDCDDSIENNNSLMCIDNNADGDRYLHRYHSSDYSSSSSRECSVTNDISYRSAGREEMNGETNLRRDELEELRAHVQEDRLIDSVGQENKLVDNTADRKETEDNIRHLEDSGGKCDAQEDSEVGLTLQEDDISEEDCLEDNVSVEDRLGENVEESVSEDNIVEDNVLEDNIVEENVLENYTVEESLLEDNVVEDIRDDIAREKDLLQDSATQDFVQVENTNMQDIQDKQMLDIVAQTDDITEDANLNDDIVEEVVEDESVAPEIVMGSALATNIVKQDMSQNGLVERIVEDIVQEYDNIGKFGISALQEVDSVLEDKTIQEADSAFEATAAEERSSALQEEVERDEIREVDSVLQEDVCQHHVQQGVEICCTEKDIEGNTLSPEQSRRTSIEEELGLPLVCQVCGFTTTRLEEQANHIRTHSYHCQRCQLAFVSQEDFKDHLTAEHPTIEELHHCLLCQRTFPTAERHAQHKNGWHHSQMERSQRHTIHSLFRLFTGNDCPTLPSLAPEEVKAFDWLPSDPGVIHFYHDATPLQLAVQDCGGAKDDTETC